MITLVASTRRATAVSDDAITTRSVGIPVALDLSEHFDGLAVTLVCKAGEVSRDIAVLDPEALEVPVECLQVAGVPLLLGLYASNAAGTKVIPTIWASAGTIRVGTEESEVSPSDPTPDWTAQVQQWAEDAHDTAERLAEQVDGWESEIDAAVDGAENVNATVSKSGDTATITVTDREGVTHTATVSDGADGQPGADGRPGADGYSPTATVTQTASGATISITDKSGTTTASVSNGTDGADGTDGSDGFSPTVDVQEIEGGHEVTITDADGAHSFEVMDGDPAAPGSITDAMLAPDGIKPQVAQLWGNQLTGELSGTIDTAADAYAAPPMALTVEGASTQAGTPTPDAPVPILSVDDLSLVVAGKNLLDRSAEVGGYVSSTGSSAGTSASGWSLSPYIPVAAGGIYTFTPNSTSGGSAYGCWYDKGKGVLSVFPSGPTTQVAPADAAFVRVSYRNESTNVQLEAGSTATAYAPYVEPTTVPDLLPEGTDLRSLPDGTKDTLNLSYLRPSTRAGWAWYSREVVQAVDEADLGDMTWTAYTISGHQIFRAAKIASSNSGVCTSLACVTNGPTTIADNCINPLSLYWNTNGHIAARADAYADAAAFKTAMTGQKLIYKLATPVTTQLDPIELPQLPAPNCTVWCDGGSAQPSFVMQYVQDTNLVVQALEAAIADLATS